MAAHEITHRTCRPGVIAGGIDNRQPHTRMLGPRLEPTSRIASAKCVPTRQRKGGTRTNLGAHCRTDSTLTRHHDTSGCGLRRVRSLSAPGLALTN
jgi:hypothetical protein